MNIDKRISAFGKLGDYLTNLPAEEFATIALASRDENPWFISENIAMAISAIGRFLNEKDLREWTSRYTFGGSPKKIALVMAGNIPLVGFHDLLAVLIAGHSAMIKLSSKDKTLPTFVLDKLMEAEPEFSSRIEISERLKDFDAVIATGSDNSSRYFDYYFGKYPHIIRRNRTSIGILSGDETDDELRDLGTDIFAYFGLGCRNVSKLFVPYGYSFDRLFRSIESFQPVIHHHKYCNNYDYQKSLLLINGNTFLDNNFLLVQESDRIISPISVLYYETWKDENELREKINGCREKIQVIAGKAPLGNILFGSAQYPGLSDYADHVDTMEFLSSL